MTVPSSQPSLTGQMQFFDNYIPVLHDGDYTISVTQNLKGSGGQDGFDVDQSFTETQKFTIAGPRFALDPADIHRAFPPPGHLGNFDQVLPHVTLTKRALPWERKVFPDTATPWLALLVFSEDEILDPVIGTAVSEADKPNPARASSILLDDLTSPPPAPVVVVPDVTFDPYETPSKALCSVIDITPETFGKVVPSQADLAYLTHGRKVNIENKSSTFTVEAPGARIEDATQWFSVIVSGRFPEAQGQANPKATGKNIAHLVTLEGLTDYVPATTGGTAAAFPAGTQRVRLVSLNSWTFSCLPKSTQDFAALMRGLVPGTDDKLRDDLLLRIPVSDQAGAPGYAAQALNAGYTARTYATRQGENTFAWYRGPFAPTLPQRFAENRRPFSVSGQAVIYDKDRGLFDMSYASAFEIGRMSAVRSGAFSGTVRAWRSKGRRLLDRLQQRLGSSAIAALFDTPAGLLQSEDVLKNALLQDSFIDYLATRFASTVLPGLEQASPAAPAGVGDKRPRTELAANEAQKLAQALGDPDIAAFLQSIDFDELAPILSFLGELYLLNNVPFDYLVPDQRMLPDESVRFFFIDRNWLDALVDGALSVGVHNGIELSFQAAMRTQIRTGLHELIHKLRDRLLGVDTPSPNDSGDLPLAGMLIRSAVVSGWPGLEVHAADAAGKEIGLMRMDHVGPQTLLCIFAGVPATVHVNEPQEGLHFGVESGNKVYLRHLSGPDVGHTLGAQDFITAKINSARMLDVEQALADLKAGLNADLGPADFAVQMIDVPERFTYAMPGAGSQP